MPKYVFNPFTAKLDVQASTKSDVGLSNVDNVQQIPLSYLDTDGTLSANSDTKVASQKATKTYADQLISSANALVYKGVIDCSANPNYPAADAGHMYIVSVAGKIGGASGVNVEVGDMIICNTDGTASGDQATVGANFNIIEKNIEGAVSGPASAVANNVATFDGTTGKIIKDSGLTLSGTNTGDVTVTDSSSIDFTLTGQALSGSVIQSGIDHGSISGLSDDDHSQYALLAGRSGGQTLIGGTANNNVLSLQGNSGTGNTATNKAISLLVGNSGATEAVTVLNNGNVGIGTTSPSDTLQLEAATQPFFSANFTNSASFGGLRFRENGTITGAYLAIGSTFSTVNRRNYMEFQSLINGGGINFWTNDGTIAERMRISGNGNVGIGTTSPNYKLHLYSNANQFLYNYIETASTGTSAGARLSLKTPETSFESVLYGTNVTGNIITGVPRSKLAFYSVGAGGSGLLFHTNDSVPMIFATADTERMRILGNGNVGIGTTSPGYPLDVKNTSGLYAFNVQSDDNNARPGIRMEARRPTNAAIAFALFDAEIGKSTGSLIYAGRVGVYGVVSDSTEGRYLFMDASPDAAYNNATFKIDADDKIGIGLSGTNRPTVKLHVVGDGTYSASFMSGNVGIGLTAPQGRFHAVDSNGGTIFETISGINSTTYRDIVSDGANDVTKAVSFLVVVTDGTSSVANFLNLLNNATTDVAVGTLTCRFRVTAGGAFQVNRQSGTGSATVAVNAVWL